MFSRSPLLSFLFGGFLLALGAILLLSVEPWRPSRLERWDESEDPTGTLLTALGLIVVGLGFSFPPVLKWASEGAFQEVALEPPAEGAPLGGETVVRVRLVPRKPLQVASAELRLISEELAQYMEEASDYNDNERQHRTRVMEVHRWSSRLAVPQDLNGPVELEVPIPIPRELPPSFRWERHMTRTRLELEVDIIGRVDLNMEKELILLPRYAVTQTP